jgi:hypothetical protein
VEGEAGLIEGNLDARRFRAATEEVRAGARVPARIAEEPGLELWPTKEERPDAATPELGRKPTALCLRPESVHGEGELVRCSVAVIRHRGDCRGWSIARSMASHVAVSTVILLG